MISSIRSLCNAIEHFQHESAIYFPTFEHNYFELMDYLLIAICLLLPSALIVKIFVFIVVVLFQLFVVAH